MHPNEISSTITTPHLRPISYPHREYHPADPDAPRYTPLKYTDHIRTGLFHTFAVEGSAGDELCVVCVIETEDGSIVTPIASKCKFLTSVTKLTN